MANIRIYRPNKTNNGCASEFQLAKSDRNKFEPYVVFLSFARQTGIDEKENASFDWKQSLKVKLGENDIGEILSVLNGAKNSVGPKGSLYHQSEKGTKLIGFTFKDDKSGYNLNVSAQDSEKKDLGKFYQSLSFGEAEILRIFLTESLKVILDLY